MKIGWLSGELNDQRIVEIFTSWRMFLFIPFLATMIFSIVHFFHRFVILAYRTRQTELEVSRLQIINTETLNQLLKQQIQPHFLFNALNTLKSLIKKQPVVAENYLIQLSDFLRASISEHRSDVVSLAEELELCSNYMEMQKIRFGEALLYNVSSTVLERHDDCIPFFSLQPLLENAIKHNELTKEKPLVIHLFLDGDAIVVENNLQKRKDVEVSTGNGLKNLKERYKILCNEDVLVVQDNAKFSVHLKLISK
ncbi:MAG: histidine kinase [Crocinitomicaceae bacterium]|nr:histidine kinase [Crocinitomicaceae bacterium]